MICPELQFFTRSVSRVVLAQEGGHAACCDAIASAMAVAEKAALTGLKGSLATLLAEVSLPSPPLICFRFTPLCQKFLMHILVLRRLGVL